MMPGYLLHQGATVQCAHLGPAQPVVVNPRVRVGGQAIVTTASTYTVTGCSLSGTGTPPCASATWVRGAQRVKAGGAAVLLQDSQATCTPTGTGLTVVTTQTRVKGT